MELGQVHGFNVEGERLSVSDPRDCGKQSRLVSIEIKSKIANVPGRGSGGGGRFPAPGPPDPGKPEAVCFNKARKVMAPPS